MRCIHTFPCIAADTAGTQGVGDEQRLYNDDSTDFDDGRTDNFTINTTDVGALQAVKLRVVRPFACAISGKPTVTLQTFQALYANPNTSWQC